MKVKIYRLTEFCRDKTTERVVSDEIRMNDYSLIQECNTEDFNINDNWNMRYIAERIFDNTPLMVSDILTIIDSNNVNNTFIIKSIGMDSIENFDVNSDTKIDAIEDTVLSVLTAIAQGIITQF